MFSDKKMYEAGLLSNAYDRLEKVFYNTGSKYNTDNIYLREIWYNTLDYDFATKYYSKNDYPISKPGACSSFSKNNFLARNYDWNYGDTVTFVVHTAGISGRYKTLGVANTPELSKNIVESGKSSVGYKLLPFHTLDGINECGLAISTNVVPCFDDEYGKVTVVNPENLIEVSTRMLVRYLLDNCASLEEVEDVVNNKLKIYTSKDLLKMNYTQHYLIKDSTGSKILEFVKNEDGIIKPIFIDGYKMTNFHIDKTDFKEDGMILTPKDRTEEDTDFIEPHAAGLERYNYITSNLDFDKSSNIPLDKVKAMLKNLNYTNTYKFIDPEYKVMDRKIWYSEFSGILGLKASDTKEKYEKSGVLEYALKAYKNRTRKNADTWETIHSSIYNIEDKTLNLRIEEGEFVNDYKQFEL